MYIFQQYENVGNTSESRRYYNYRAPTCVRHDFAWQRTTEQRLSSAFPCFHSPRLHTMTVTSTSDPASIFKDGKLKPGVYKIQNIVGQTYVDIREHTRELCGRPATVLEGKGLVSSCLYLAPTILSLPSVGNPPFGSRVYHTQSSVELCSSFLCTERGNIARTRHA